MESNRKTAAVVGALFLLAMVTSLLGGVWLESILEAPETLEAVSTNQIQVVSGVLLELINGLAVVGIAVLMYPILKKQNEALALGYVALRIIEAVIVVAAVVSPLTLIALSQEYAAAGSASAPYIQTLGASFIEVRTMLVGQMLGIFFSLAALIFYYLLYQSVLVPRFIPIWGFISVALVLIWNLLELFGISISAGMIFALSMILNEVFMGLWLIVKGFNPSAVTSGLADQKASAPARP